MFKKRLFVQESWAFANFDTGYCKYESKRLISSLVLIKIYDPDSRHLLSGYLKNSKFGKDFSMVNNKNYTLFPRT